MKFPHRSPYREAMKKKESGSEAIPDGRLTHGWALLRERCKKWLRVGVTMGLPIRETRIGALSSACGGRARFANAQALFAISDFRHAESRTAGA